MRLDTDVQVAINMIAGEYQRATGRNFTASRALREFIQKYRPDIMKAAEEAVKTLKDSDPAAEGYATE